MILAAWATAPLTGGLDGPVGGRIPQPDGFTEIASEPFARALVLDDNYHQAALVQVDLFALDAETRALATERIWEAVRIPPSRVFFVPTGIMTAPLAATPPDGRGRPEPYAAYVAAQLASAVIYAARARRPASVGWARGESVLGRVAGHAVRGPSVFCVDDLGGEPVALVAGLPSLPAATGRVVDTGYPGAYCAAIERFGERCGALGLLGPAAGVDPVLDDDRLFGEQLAGLAWAAGAAVETDSSVTLRTARRAIDLPLAVPDMESAEARLERAEARLEEHADPLYARAAEAERRRAAAALEAARSGFAAATVEIGAVAVADGAWLLSPLLLAPAAASRLAGSPFGERLQVVSGANGLAGVLTDAGHRLPMLEGWYAPLPFAVDASERWADAALAVLDDVAQTAEDKPVEGSTGTGPKRSSNGGPVGPGDH